MHGTESTVLREVSQAPKDGHGVIPLTRGLSPEESKSQTQRVRGECRGWGRGAVFNGKMRKFWIRMAGMVIQHGECRQYH